MMGCPFRGKKRPSKNAKFSHADIRKKLLRPLDQKCPLHKQFHVYFICKSNVKQAIDPISSSYPELNGYSRLLIYLFYLLILFDNPP